MHETSLIGEMIRMVEAELAEVGAHGRVTEVALRLEPLACASAESLRFAYELLTPGTVLEGAALAIEQEAPGARCRTCGRRVEEARLGQSCAACGSEDVSFEGGGEVIVERIEIETEDARLSGQGSD